MTKRRDSRMGSSAGSLLAFSLMNGDGGSRKKVAPAAKTEAQIRQEEFEQMRQQGLKDTIIVDVPTNAYERQITGKPMKAVEVNRAEYEQQHGVTDLRRIWGAQDVETLQLLVQDNNPLQRLRLVDTTLRLPHTADGNPVELTDENAAAAVKAGSDFIEANNLDNDSRDKLVMFVTVQIDADSRIDPRNPLTWERAYSRLIELGAINEQPQARAPEKPEKSIDQMSTDDARTETEKRWLSIFSEVWNQWLDSMAQTWGFYPNQDQQRKAIDLLLKLEQFGNDKFNEARRRLTKSGVFPAGMLTELEKLELRVENNEFGDLSRPENKQRYADAFFQVKFGH